MNRHPFVALLLSLPLANAFGWSDIGHQAVGKVAESLLAPKTRTRIQALLPKGEGLDAISTCADRIKQGNAYLCAGDFTVPGMAYSANWHFLDYEITTKPDTGAEAGLCTVGGQDSACVIDQIQNHLDTLADTALPLLKRQIALMFVVHFLGDLHQPLHCADNQDRGGNNKPVTWKPKVKVSIGKPELHATWDNLGYPNDNGYTSAGLADSVQALMATHPAWPRDWRRGTIKTWALQSESLAVHRVYPDYKKLKGKYSWPAYARSIRPVIFTQIGRAGVRLAMLLDSAFAGPAGMGAAK